MNNMKRNSFILAAAMLAGSWLTGPMRAEAQVTNAPRPVVSTNTPGGRPAMMRDRTDFWAQRLKLNDEQKAKLKPILEEENQKYVELRKQVNLKVDERRAKFTAIREETNAKLKPILTPEQYEQYTRPFQTRTNAPMVRPTNVAPAAPAK
jgi:Spy/CpxP family protein refolding chaperone